MFIYTEKQLLKKFGKKNSYFDILATLYQNGFDLNCSESEIKEQLELLEIKNYDDIVRLRKEWKLDSSSEIGKKIIVEELYDIVKLGSFSMKEMSSTTIIKTYTSSNWNNIICLTNRIKDLFDCRDAEIRKVIVSIDNVDVVFEKLEALENTIEKELKVATWNYFSDLIKLCYKIYIKIGKEKADFHKLTIHSNINEELYSAVGGYNPNTREIKTMVGSAVSNVKACYDGNELYMKMSAAEIVKDLPKDEKDHNMLVLKNWVKSKTGNIEEVKRIIVNCLLNGILNLLIIKHNISLYEDDKRNWDRAEKVKDEFSSIIKWCGIDKEYLM